MIKKLNLIFMLTLMLLFQQDLYAEPIKKTIMIDLDGVLDNYTSYTSEIPNIRRGAKEFIIKLYDNYELRLPLKTTFFEKI